MGYSLYITRSKRIKKQEWLDLVKRDRWLKPHTDDLPHANLMVNGEPAGILMWSNGQIEVNSPDEPMFKKMLSIAKRLDAKIQGDDGEAYDSLKDFRCGNDLDAYARSQERIWRAFETICTSLLKEAGFEEVRNNVWWRRNAKLPVHDMVSTSVQGPGENGTVGVSWGFWFDFAPMHSGGDLKWEESKSKSFMDYQVDRSRTFEVGSPYRFTPAEARTSANACRTRLQAVIAEAEELFTSATTLSDLLGLFETETKWEGFAHHEYSWACVLLAMGKIDEGMRKVNAYLERYRKSFKAEDVVPRMHEILKRHEQERCK